MGAYNNILLPNVRCPVCGEITDVTAQTHFASSYDGDDTGRFALRTFRLGEAMPWFPKESPKFGDWRKGAVSIVQVGDGRLQECCYSDCQAHGDQLYAVIEFVDMTPVRLVALRAKKDWPPDFPR